MSGNFKSIAVFGPGLMGGSLLMAMRRRHPHVRLGVWARRPEALEDVKRRGLADFASTDAPDVARQAECIVLCLPVDKMRPPAEAIAGEAGPETMVTDVGSVKRPVVDELEDVFAKHGNFVGSHPMCGSEEAGMAAARADLYDNALCVVTPTARSRPEMVQAAEDLWRMVGARVATMAPGRHDRAAALVSHVPHVAAAALVELVAAESPDVRQLCAGGFRDTTRVASGPADLWTAILALNRDETVRALGELTDLLGSIRAALADNRLKDVATLLAAAAAHRAEILENAK